MYVIIQMFFLKYFAAFSNMKNMFHRKVVSVCSVFKTEFLARLVRSTAKREKKLTRNHDVVYLMPV